VALAAAGCGGDDPKDGGITDGGIADGGVKTDLGKDGGDVVFCTGPGSPRFPTFNKACSVPADCVIGLHQLNCCGSLLAIGNCQANQCMTTAR
jgi:hypothetical protein